MVRYATAIRVGTPSAETILHRFTRNTSHPVYQDMLDLGRAERTTPVYRTLREVVGEMATACKDRRPGPPGGGRPCPPRLPRHTTTATATPRRRR